MNADGTHRRQATTVHDATAADWSPDGRWIVFTTSTCGITDGCLDALDLTTSEVTVLDGIGAS